MHSVRLSVPELSSAEYVKIAFNSKQKLEQFTAAVHVLHKRKIWSFDVVVFQGTAKKCTEIITHVQSHCASHYNFCLATFSLP